MDEERMMLDEQTFLHARAAAVVVARPATATERFNSGRSRLSAHGRHDAFAVSEGTDAVRSIADSRR
jgi:hypothetical protein